MSNLANYLSIGVFVVSFVVTIVSTFGNGKPPGGGTLIGAAVTAGIAAVLARIFLGMILDPDDEEEKEEAEPKEEAKPDPPPPPPTPPAPAGLGYRLLVWAWIVGILLCVGLPPMLLLLIGHPVDSRRLDYIVPVFVSIDATILTILGVMTGLRHLWVNRRQVAEALRYTPPVATPVPAPAPAGINPAARSSHCPSCRAPLAADSPQGLCPKCLLKQAFAPSPVATGPYHSDIPPDAAEVAQFLPHLEILELIGQGGMGAVYKARQPALDRFVALKLIRPRDDDPTFAERFGREAKALAKLSHPHVVTIYESGVAGGCLYLLMEYVEGVTLRQAMQSKSLTPAQTLTIIGQLCDALQYAHSKGVVHRDVKPENVLLDAAGNVKVADFGLAKVADPAGFSLTRTNQAMGTPHYMAPEQWEAAASVDHRADIYALGVVLYELLTGELPLGRFDPPSLKARIDARIDEVVLRALAKEPGRRFQSADDVRSALDVIRTGKPVYACRRKQFYEYKSKTEYLGWPLVHVTSGIDPTTGRPKVAKGWIAVGDGMAIGGLAVAGGMAAGGVCVAGGGSFGLIGLSGGMSFALLLALAGGISVGGVAVAGGVAVGVFAAASFSIGVWAIGAKAVGFRVIQQNRQDADFWDSITDLFG